MSGFGENNIKQEGMARSYISGLAWNGYTKQMEEQYQAEYSKWYYWPIRKIIRKAFINAWHGALKEEAKNK